MLAGLPYVLWPVGSLFVLASRKKDDPYLHYHAVQGGLFGAAMSVVILFGCLGLGITFRLLPGTSTWLPGMMGMAAISAAGLVLMAIFFTAIFLGWRATEGEMIRLPFAGDFAENKMLDHTGMTRREFIEMLEKSFIEPSFDEPEPIPFPAVGQGVATSALTGRAAEVMAAQTQAQDSTPAAQKAAELLAHRQAKQAAAQKAQAAQAAALAAQQKASNLAAQQAAALQAAQRPLPQQPGPQRANGGGQSSPQRANNGGGQAPPQRPVQAPPQPTSPAARAQASEAKSYPLIGGTGGAGGNVLQPSSPQRSAQPPQKSQTPSGWQQSPGQPMPPAQSTPGMAGNPQVKEVDLIRHYKERRSAPAQQSDALRNWLSAVDDNG